MLAGAASNVPGVRGRHQRIQAALADWPAFWQTLHQSVQVKLSTTFSIQPD
jgi:hypothetical protein